MGILYGMPAGRRPKAPGREEETCGTAPVPKKAIGIAPIPIVVAPTTDTLKTLTQHPDEKGTRVSAHLLWRLASSMRREGRHSAQALRLVVIYDQSTILSQSSVCLTTGA